MQTSISFCVEKLTLLQGALERWEMNVSVNNLKTMLVRGPWRTYCELPIIENSKINSGVLALLQISTV